MPRWSTRCASIVVFAVMAPLAALASDPELIVSFNEASFELPEGIAVDKRGNVFVGLGFLGLVQKIPAGSTTPEPFGAIPGFVPIPRRTSESWVSRSTPQGTSTRPCRAS